MECAIKLYPLEEKSLEQLTTRFTFPWTTREQTVEKWKKYLEEHKSKSRHCFLLEVDNYLVGYGSLVLPSNYPFFSSQDIPEIHDVWIDEGYRGRGFATKLIQELESFARQSGFIKIGIGVGLYKDYGSAQKLYVNLGYVPDGNGITSHYQIVKPGQEYVVDDDLVLWFVKPLINDPLL